MATIGLRKLVAEVRLAAKLLQSGSIPARLQPDAEVLDQLGVGGDDRSRLAVTPVAEQLDILQRYLAATIDRERSARQEIAVAAADQHVAELRRATRQHGLDLELSAAPLCALVSVPAFEFLQVESAERPIWRFPRVLLGKILQSVQRCSNVATRLSDRHLVITYTTGKNGRGRMSLRDQGLVPRHERVLRVMLSGATTPESTTKGPTTRPPRPSPVPTRHWLLDAAYGLLEDLVA